jgi:murein DD-endopeptidase MepM/ murein hydrolase activator NlpD
MNVTNGPPSTWAAHQPAFRLGQRPASYPHRRRPHPSVYDDFDAAMAAGSLLRANGADTMLGERTWNAVRAYNGTGPAAVAYADAVMSHARAWAQASSPVGGGPGSTGVAMAWPARGPITSPFCERRAWEACHPGIDIAVPSDTAILAATAGRVSLLQTTNQSGGYGNFTCLQHTTAVSTCYAHQARILVRLGQLVARGQPIGISDCTGRCYGSHLHFEVRLDNQPICPARYLDATPAALCAPGSPGS